LSALVNLHNIVIGNKYKIATVGTTTDIQWTTVGHSTPDGQAVVVGDIFTATSAFAVGTAGTATVYNRQSTAAEYGTDLTTDDSFLNSSLKKGSTSLADACLLAISVALTKQAYGNEILLNDPILRGKLRAKIRDHINKMVGYNSESTTANTGLHGVADGGYLTVTIDTNDIEGSVNSGGSIINQYLTSSDRSSQGATAEAQNLELDNVDITFKIVLTGSVTDSDAASVAPTAAVVKAVFGENPLVTPTVPLYQTKVQYDSTPIGQFEVNVLVSIKNIRTVALGASTTATKNIGLAVSSVSPDNVPVGGGLAITGDGL